ncbi:MAG TPA: ABC transporter permease [Pyrinomonadaceae bacterium]|nr:ABC transporter permease [Pyrinomonadaceae bacterium]
METLLKDIRYGVRSFLKRPGFLIIALSTLALGIGATTAMFTVVNSVLLQPLQFPEPERIVLLEGIQPSQGITDSNMSVPDIDDWKKQSQSFEQIASFIWGGIFVTFGDEVERVRATSVSAEFFPVFRTNPIQGRWIGADDTQEKSGFVAVISHELWQRRFGGAANVVNSQINIRGTSTTIVGIMPPGFNYPNECEMWVAFKPNLATEPRDNRYVNVVARLKPNVSLDQVRTEMDTINQRLAQTYPVTNMGWGVKITELRERMVGQLRTSLLILLGAVAVVLLIACANVANLLLARAAYRQKEIALRTALGASRLRVVRQLLTESVLLSLVSGLLGLGLSMWLLKLLIAISPADSPRFKEIGIEWRVFIFALGVTILAGLLFGLVPALHTSRPDLNETLKESGRQGGAGSSRNRVGSLLIVSEIALSFVLLVSAGLLIKSFMNLRRIDPGFTPDNVLAFRLAVINPTYNSDEKRTQIWRQLVDQVKATPGVQSVGAISSLPLGGDTFNLGRSVVREGDQEVPENAINAAHLIITGDYFQTLKIPVKAGRIFNDQDNMDSVKVAIINEGMARRLWPGENPIGKRFRVWRDEKFSREVVGVVGDTKHSLDEEARNQVYVSYGQSPTWSSLTFVVRTAGEPTALAGAVREALRSVDKTLPTYNLKTMDDVVSISAAPRRLPMQLLSAFAGVAMFLAMLGIYGVTSYYVTQRTHEIGIRMALGARMNQIMRLVLKQGMVLVFLGIVAGAVGSWFATRLMSSLLFGVRATDSVTFMLIAVLLILVALVACYIPARRATKVDPMVALRYE